MRKKLLVMLMAICMTVSLVACGNTGGNDNSGGASETVVDSETNGDADSSESSDTEVEVSNKNEEQQRENETQEADASDEQQSTNLDLTVEAEYANLPESQGFEFTSNGDGTCTLTKIGECSDEDIVIPEKSSAGDKVTMIAEYAFYGAEDINSIIFAGKTMELDNKAFQSCEVEKIIISGCNLVIGENAFSYCEDITEVYINNSNIEIDTYAFYDAGKDMSVKIMNCTGVLDEKAFQSCAIEELMISGSTMELGENVFSYCEDLAIVSMDNSTLEFGTYAFYDAFDDGTATFMNCGLDIDDKAFQSCGLISLNVSGGDIVMSDNAFSYCEDLTDVIIGGNSIEIGEYCFYECTSLVNVSIAVDSDDDSLEIIIDNEAFQSCSVQNVVIGRGNIELGDNAFSYCEDLVSVDIKGVLADIGDYAFYGCSDGLVINYKETQYNEETIEDAE